MSKEKISFKDLKEKGYLCPKCETFTPHSQGRGTWRESVIIYADKDPVTGKLISSLDNEEISCTFHDSCGYMADGIPTRDFEVIYDPEKGEYEPVGAYWHEHRKELERLNDKLKWLQGRRKIGEKERRKIREIAEKYIGKFFQLEKLKRDIDYYLTKEAGVKAYWSGNSLYVESSKGRDIEVKTEGSKPIVLISDAKELLEILKIKARERIENEFPEVLDMNIEDAVDFLKSQDFLLVDSGFTHYVAFSLVDDIWKEVVEEGVLSQKVVKVRDFLEEMSLDKLISTYLKSGPREGVSAEEIEKVRESNPGLEDIYKDILAVKLEDYKRPIVYPTVALVSIKEALSIVKERTTLTYISKPVRKRKEKNPLSL